MAYRHPSPSHPMQIVVEGDGNTVYPFYVNPDQPLKVIKYGLRHYFDPRVTPPRLLLVRNGKDLFAESDDCTLHQCGIIDGDATFVLGYKCRFYVRFTCVAYFFEYLVQVDRYDTVRMLKQAIEERTGLSEDEQQLEHRGVALLMPERTLLSYGIVARSHRGHICKITVHLKDNIRQYYRNLAAQVLSKEGISIPHAYPPPMMQIHIKTGYSFEPFTLNVSPLTRVSTLKLALEKKYGCRREQLLLLLMEDGGSKDLLEEGEEESSSYSLEQCGIEAGVTLLLGYKGHLHVRAGVYGIYEIGCSDTVGDLHDMIQLARPFKLSFCNVVLREPKRTLFSYGLFRTKIGAQILSLELDFLKPRSDFLFEPKLVGRKPRCRFIDHARALDPSAIQVFIEIIAAGVIKQVVTLICVPGDTVDYAKSVIAHELERDRRAHEINRRAFVKASPYGTFIWEGPFVLQFQGQLLEDDSRTLGTLGIKTDSILQLYDPASLGLKG